ncbi:restriction endonuclease subunit S [Frankia sp. CcWB2]
MTDDHRGWLFGTACLRLRPYQAIESRYLLYYLGHPAVRGWTLRNASGSAVPTLTAGIMRAMPLLLPPRSIQERIAGILSVWDGQSAVHDRISRAGAGVRDSLLALLVSDAILRDGPPSSGERRQRAGTWCIK